MGIYIYMMLSKDVKTNLLSHSEIKVRLLGLYLKRYLAIMSNVGYNERIRLYDLFCGEGQYENGGEGSPLVILRTIKTLKESGVVRGPLPPMQCQFNDIELSKVQKAMGAAEKKGLIDEAVCKVEFTSLDYKYEVKKAH